MVSLMEVNTKEGNGKRSDLQKNMNTVCFLCSEYRIKSAELHLSTKFFKLHNGESNGSAKLSD